MKAIFLLSVLFISSTSICIAQKGFAMKDKPQEKKVEIIFNGRAITAYCYFDSTEKPVLFPIHTVSGTTITRGFPITPREGERADHPHHVGLWLTYESVNGLDFWNNSYAIPAERKHLYGSIRHQKVVSKSAKGNNASLTTLSTWVNQEGKVLMEETTTFEFSISGNDFVIDRTSKLTAMQNITFRDVKDGLLGIRVARELEMPSTQQDRFVMRDGKETADAFVNNEGVTGLYKNREDVKGDSVWSSQSTWAVLTGQIKGKTISIAIIDHPKNPGYPTYWHARGYGLFAANPLGRNVFSKGKETFNYSLEKGQSGTFKYRIVIHEGDEAGKKLLDQYEADFARK